MKIKKLPRQFALILLTGGASLILGLLSFGGMLALWPILSLALSAFVLSVAYEGEIYLQNIKGALNKLFKYNYTQGRVANEYLLQHFPDITQNGCPQFFLDYQAQCRLLMQFEHKTLDKTSAAKRKQIAATLSDMEAWFAQQLFLPSADNTGKLNHYQKNLQDWLKTRRVTLAADGKTKIDWLKRSKDLDRSFLKVKVFSALAAVFMGIGTSYLLVEAFAVIPVLATLSAAALPALIIPMALIAGVAYGLLTYNATTDLIINKTVQNWFNKLKADWQRGISARTVFMSITTFILVGLAATLTLCTAGTWWTVVKEARPLFAWMAKIPSFVMGVINPIVTGLSAFMFNVQNTAESLEIIDGAVRSNTSLWSHLKAAFFKTLATLNANENWMQWLNPFRVGLTLLVLPLRILFFIGHLFSIGLTADRVPGIPKAVSALFGFVSEGFEDMHYFVGHTHNHDHACDHDHDHDDHDGFDAFLRERLGPGHSHSHDVDLPTRLLKVVFAPIYALAALWDMATSRMNSGSKKSLSWADAWRKQRGIPVEESIQLDKNALKPSAKWKVEHAVFSIERYKREQLSNAAINRKLAANKVAHLSGLQEEIQSKGEVDEVIRGVKKAPYDQHRCHISFFTKGKTATMEFLDELPARVALGA